MLFKSRDERMSEKVFAYDTNSRVTFRNASYNPRIAAQMKHKPVGIVQEARKVL